MLRTNSKKAITNIRAYILDHYTPDESIEGQPAATTFTEAARRIYAEFLETFYRRGNYQEQFVEWLAGLPSLIDAEHYYKPAVPIVAELLEETETEAARYTETQAERLLSNLIYREIIKAV